MKFFITGFVLALCMSTGYIIRKTYLGGTPQFKKGQCILVEDTPAKEFESATYAVIRIDDLGKSNYLNSHYYYAEYSHTWETVSHSTPFRYFNDWYLESASILAGCPGEYVNE